MNNLPQKSGGYTDIEVADMIRDKVKELNAWVTVAIGREMSVYYSIQEAQIYLRTNPKIVVQVMTEVS